jgi:Ran GTPase-activating protein (RanGAP) involved in mRNA processing and transport
LEFLEELVAGLLESNIRVLGLRGNHFGTDGAALIAELLGQMERLDIGQNNLRTPGLEVICSALITNDTLAYLDVQDNEIDEMGLKIVANTLV